MKLDVGEFRDAIDGQEEEDLALGRAQLAGVDVDVTDLGLGEALALLGVVFVFGQPRNAVPNQAAVQCAARELWDALA